MPAATPPIRRRPRRPRARCGRPTWIAATCAARPRTRPPPRWRRSRRCARRCWTSSATSPAGRGAVLDGRDIGTVVFPDAPVKLFVTASCPSGPVAAGWSCGRKGIAADGPRRGGDAAHATRATRRASRCRPARCGLARYDRLWMRKRHSSGNRGGEATAGKFGPLERVAKLDIAALRAYVCRQIASRGLRRLPTGPRSLSAGKTCFRRGPRTPTANPPAIRPAIIP